jgi:hypothetical protein
MIALTDHLFWAVASRAFSEPPRLQLLRTPIQPQVGSYSEISTNYRVERLVRVFPKR